MPLNGVRTRLVFELAIGLVDSALEVASRLSQCTTNVAEFTRSEERQYH